MSFVQAAKRQGINLHFLVADGEQAIWCAAREVWPDCGNHPCLDLRLILFFCFCRDSILPNAFASDIQVELPSKRYNSIGGRRG
jgi:hypothetical protein